MICLTFCSDSATFSYLIRRIGFVAFIIISQSFLDICVKFLRRGITSAREKSRAKFYFNGAILFHSQKSLNYSRVPATNSIAHNNPYANIPTLMTATKLSISTNEILNVYFAKWKNNVILYRCKLIRLNSPNKIRFHSLTSECVRIFYNIHTSLGIPMKFKLRHMYLFTDIQRTSVVPWNFLQTLLLFHISAFCRVAWIRVQIFWIAAHISTAAKS